MSTLKPTKKISRRQELRQDTVVTFSAKVWQFVDQNRAVAYGALGALVLVAAGIVGYSYLQSQRNAEAQQYLAPVVRVYEKGMFAEALEGTGLEMGLLAIAEEYGSTDAGNLAHFYAADALYRQGENDRALAHFEAVEKTANYVGASALAGEAAIYETKSEHPRAAELYKRAALLFPNEVQSPFYLIEAGRAFENAGDYARAIETYELVSKEYAQSMQARDVDMLVARVEAKRNSSS